MGVLKSSIFLLSCQVAQLLAIPIVADDSIPDTETVTKPALDVAAAVANSQQPTNGDPNNQYSTATTVITAILLMLTGALFTFYGRHLFRTVLFITGFYVLSLVAFVIVAKNEPLNADGSAKWGDKRELIYLGICLAAGIVGGFLMSYLWRVGLFFIGVLGGFSLALFVLGWASTWQSEVGRSVVLGLSSLVGGILALIFEHAIVVFSTSLAGSFAVFTGIDFFAKTGFAELTKSMLNPQSKPLPFDAVGNKPYFMIIGWFLLFVVGCIVQHRWTASHMRRTTYRQQQIDRTTTRYGK